MLTVNDILEGTGGTLVAARAPEGATFSRGIIDSRQAAAGDLFFALRGENHDAHDFVPEAFRSGAAGAVVSRPVEAGEHAVFHVSDPLSALQRLAAFWRRRHDVRVVGITGSVGKTTCKELTAAVLSSRYRTLKSEANINTEIGIPLTLLQLTKEHERAVLEFGMHLPGDIELLADIAAPDVGVVTNVGPVHMERAGSIGAIGAAKAELVEALPADGLAVLNGDDPRVTVMSRWTRARTQLYGLGEQCDVRGSDIETRGLDGISFTITHEGKSVRAECPLPGRHHAYPALAATAVALGESLSLEEIAAALAEARSGLRLTVRSGVNGCTIIDDSYNARAAGPAHRRARSHARAGRRRGGRAPPRRQAHEGTLRHPLRRWRRRPPARRRGACGWPGGDVNRISGRGGRDAAQRAARGRPRADQSLTRGRAGEPRRRARRQA